jgi:diguanylate cyclase (GGDEF)-like protein
MWIPLRRVTEEDLAPVVIGSFALELLAGMVDHALPHQSTVWVLHFVPIALLTWYCGRFCGLLLVIVGFAATVVRWRLQEAPGPLLIGGYAEVALREALLLGAVMLTAQVRATTRRAVAPVRTDTSTGLANSRALFELAGREIDRAQRYERCFTLAYVGVDSLPAIRQRAGREAAEELLRQVAHRIQSSLRTVDVVARLRTQEFALLLPETDVEAARVVLGRIERGIDATLTEAGHTPVAVNIGAVTWIQAGISVEALHQRAYQLLHAARQGAERVEHVALDQGRLEPVLRQEVEIVR